MRRLRHGLRGRRQAHGPPTLLGEKCTSFAPSRAEKTYTSPLALPAVTRSPSDVRENVLRCLLLPGPGICGFSLGGAARCTARRAGQRTSGEAEGCRAAAVSVD